MLVTRYLAKNVFSVTVFMTLTLSAVIWLSQSLKLLELIASSDAPPGLYIQMVALTLPRFLEIVLPVSLTIGVLFIYNKMIMENEIVVMRSCGFDQLALAKPALLIAGGLAIILLSMTTYISPRSYTLMQSLKQDVQAQYSSFLLREGVFNTFNNNLTIYMRRREQNGDLLGLMIYDGRDKTKSGATVVAKRGRIVMDGSTPNIIVYDGIRQQMADDKKSISRLYFSKYTIEINGLTSDPQSRWREPTERTLQELLFPNTTDRRDMNSRDLFLAEAHKRIVMPMHAISFTLISLTCMLMGGFDRRGQAKKVFLAGVLVCGLLVGSLGINSAARKNLMLVPIMYMMPLVPIGTCLMLLRGPKLRIPMPAATAAAGGAA